MFEPYGNPQIPPYLGIVRGPFVDSQATSRDSGYQWDRGEGGSERALINIGQVLAQWGRGGK